VTKSQPRRGRGYLIAMAVVATLGLGVPAVWKNYEASLPPLDLKAALRGSTVAVDRHGKLLRAFTTEDGRWRLPVTVDDVDPRFIDMLLAYEDRRFYSHHGVDWQALARAAGQMLRHGRIVSGGSTITMQVARLIDPPQDQRSLAAKLRQVVRALELERTLKKREILDLYLALAPYGGNLEGLRAASLSWFGKEPRRLSFAEQALLVGLPQAPEARRPDRDLAAALRARDRILARSQQAGLLSREEQIGALREAFKGERKAFPAYASHAAAAAHAAEPQRRVLQFTIDQRLQASLEQLVRENVDRLGPKVTGALLAIDNATGEILAHVGSADHLSQERAGAIDMTQALRSPGSTLKPFIYALAFEDGLAHPETLMEDRRARYGIYAPENFDMTFQGQITARKALQNSLNVPAVALLNDLGPGPSGGPPAKGRPRGGSPGGTPGRPPHRAGRLGYPLARSSPPLCGFGAARRRARSDRPARPATASTSATAYRRARRRLVCRRYPARRTAADQCAVRRHFVQDRHVLWLSRCLRRWLRPQADDRGLVWSRRQWRRTRSSGTPSGGAGVVRCLLPRRSDL